MAFHEGLVKLDVFAHEFTHAVTASRSGLVYLNQSGALNEAYSDVFSEFIEGNGKWLGGEELSVPESALTGPLRNMINPPAKGDPWNYANRYTGADDKGGVHTNSGIINHAVYLLVNGTHDSSGAKRTGFNYTATGKNGRDYAVEIGGGLGQVKAQQLLFDSQAYMIPTESFLRARSSIVLTCDVMVFFGQHGFTDRDCGKVINAFAAVGIGPGDRDFDTIVDREDNCEMDYNPLQEDKNGDGIGDLCETPEIVLADPTETPEPTVTTTRPAFPIVEVSSITSFENEAD